MFQTALSNVLLTLLYILPGYAACKFRKASADHLPTMSSVLVYVCSPFLTISSFLQMEFSWENLAGMGLFALTVFLLESAFMAILYALFRRKYADSRYRILTIGAVLGNIGFFGLPIVRALLPENPEVLCYACMYSVANNILMFTMGVFCLTQKKESMTVKTALLNPSAIGLCLSLPLYIFRLGPLLPDLLVNSMRLLANMTTPLCMIILGIRLATVPPKRLFTRPFVYAICLAKLLAFPLFCYLVTLFLPLPFPFRASILVLSSVPCASNILNMAEIHKSETELSANCVLASTLLCFLTVPTLTMLLK